MVDGGGVTVTVPVGQDANPLSSAPIGWIDATVGRLGCIYTGDVYATESGAGSMRSTETV